MFLDALIGIQQAFCLSTFLSTGYLIGMHHNQFILCSNLEILILTVITTFFIHSLTFLLPAFKVTTLICVFKNCNLKISLNLSH